MKSLFLSLFLMAATALGARTFAQTTTITFPVTGGSYTVYAPAGYKFLYGPSGGGGGFTFSYATTGDICGVYAAANTTYYDRSVTVTWTLTPKTGGGTPSGTLTYAFYQPGNTPPPFAGTQDTVSFTPAIPLLNKQ